MGRGSRDGHDARAVTISNEDIRGGLRRSAALRPLWALAEHHRIPGRAYLDALSHAPFIPCYEQGPFAHVNVLWRSCIWRTAAGHERRLSVGVRDARDGQPEFVLVSSYGRPDRGLNGHSFGYGDKIGPLLHVLLCEVGSNDSDSRFSRAPATVHAFSTTAGHLTELELDRIIRERLSER